MSKSSKIKIINNDSKPYSSFNAYTRPQRVESEYRYQGGGKIVNLDPTDDPEKVCEAYRQIAIANQNRRIVKNRQKAELRKREEYLSAHKAAAIADQKRLKDKLRMQSYVTNSPIGMRRAKLLKDLQAGMYKVNPNDRSKSQSAGKDVADLRSKDHDVLTITTAACKIAAGKEYSAWAIDHFKRFKGIIAGSSTPNLEELSLLLKPFFEQGYFVTMDNIDNDREFASLAIGELRVTYDMSICVAINRRVEATARGWIMPCQANGLINNECP